MKACSDIVCPHCRHGFIVLLEQTSSLRSSSRHDAHPDFIHVLQQIKWVLINAVSSGPFEFVLPVTAGKKTDAKCSCALCSQQIPNTVPHHHRLPNVNVEAL